MGYRRSGNNTLEPSTSLGLDPVQCQGFSLRFAKQTSLSHPSLKTVTSRRPMCPQPFMPLRHHEVHFCTGSWTAPLPSWSQLFTPTSQLSFGERLREHVCWIDSSSNASQRYVLHGYVSLQPQVSCLNMSQLPSKSTPLHRRACR